MRSKVRWVDRVLQWPQVPNFPFPTARAGDLAAGLSLPPIVWFGDEDHQKTLMETLSGKLADIRHWTAPANRDAAANL
jgi:hypothetical protein